MKIKSKFEVMIPINELRINNLVLLNPELPGSTTILPPVLVEVAAIEQDKIGYRIPGFDHKAASFEDNPAMKTVYKLPEELEPINLTSQLLETSGFEKQEDLRYSEIWYFKKENFTLVQLREKWQVSYGLYGGISIIWDRPLCLHQLQNLYFDLTGKELI